MISYQKNVATTLYPNQIHATKMKEVLSKILVIYLKVTLVGTYIYIEITYLYQTYKIKIFMRIFFTNTKINTRLILYSFRKLHHNKILEQIYLPYIRRHVKTLSHNTGILHIFAEIPELIQSFVDKIFQFYQISLFEIVRKQKVRL